MPGSFLLPPAPPPSSPPPAVHASYRFFEFFTAQIRNPHTRRAYARAAVEFFERRL
jgi:hypothetical protein